MLWVYGHYKQFYSYSAGIDFSRQNRRQILTTKVDPRAVRVNPYKADMYLHTFTYQIQKGCFFFNFNHHTCPSYLFPLHLNTYVMGLRPS